MRRVAFALVSIGSAAVPAVAWSQTYEAPPPIDVPTAAVPQVLTPFDQKAKPATTTAPAAKPPPPPPASTTTSAPASTSTSAAPATTYNNEGVFKVSGGPSYGGTGKPATSSTAKPATTTKWIPPKDAGVVAQWPGFRMTPDGGSEVMIEFSKTIAAPTEHKAAGVITYVFKGAHVTKYNNENPLLTVHFNTPLISARLVPKGSELHLVIELRAGVDATPTTGTRAPSEGTGQQFFVSFAKGSYLPPGDDEPWSSKPTAKSEEGKPIKVTPKTATTTTTTGTGKPSIKTDLPPPPASTGGSKMGPKP